MKLPLPVLVVHQICFGFKQPPFDATFFRPCSVCIGLALPPPSPLSPLMLQCFNCNTRATPIAINNNTSFAYYCQNINRTIQEGHYSVIAYNYASKDHQKKNSFTASFRFRASSKTLNMASPRRSDHRRPADDSGAMAFLTEKHPWINSLLWFTSKDMTQGLVMDAGNIWKPTVSSGETSECFNTSPALGNAL